MNRYICVHGHFYQPPRENPCLEAIELQESAHPYHDWNERITAECYAPNAAARILDERGRIARIVSNYESISFNFGPTLLAWMEEHARESYRALLEADRASRARFSGHGSALAQVYHHAIMPLCNARDKRTQVRWGIRDFERRFARRPEGMWLAETAVDLESLDLLAEHGILFTILAPRQARRVRRSGAAQWSDASGGRIDAQRPYRLDLPSGRSIALFFYDGPISQAIAFEGLLSDGEQLVRRLLGGFAEKKRGAQLVPVAVDGETFGHHHKYGEMALAYALAAVEARGLARLTNFGEYLEMNPPGWEAEIVENSSWSCVHGVERWRGDCGCSVGRGGLRQAWRKPLREALDWLRDSIAPLFEREAAPFLKSPWDARDAYVALVLDRGEEALRQFLAAQATRPLERREVQAVLELLEMQRHALHMYTSCGWFFDDLAGIETVQVLFYAGRVLQLAAKRFGPGLEEPFLQRLARAESNDPTEGNGRALFESQVRPGLADLETVAAHHAVSGFFGERKARERIYCYALTRESCHTDTRNGSHLCLGRVEVRSEVTSESALLSYGFVHFGGHLLNGGIARLESDQEYLQAVAEVSATFRHGDLRAILRAIERRFGAADYSLRSLFRDEQRRIAALLLEEEGAEVEAKYRRIYDQLLPLLEFLNDLTIPVPRIFRPAAEFALDSYLREALETVPPDAERVHGLLKEARSQGIALDMQQLGFTLRRGIDALADQLRGDAQNVELLDHLERAIDLCRSAPFPLDLWRAQNACWALAQSEYGAARARALAGDASAREWIERFARLLDKLAMRPPSA
ncbi:MAG: DUF3536 domain-containing protein [Planctomycetes bacterium]|nr:DUF3536 domain-containing protein [Planctomycetota bacterium]